MGCDLLHEFASKICIVDFNPRTHRGVRLWTRCQNQGETYFNPRTHRGVRHSAYQVYMTLKKFQSTHPSWGATRRLIKNTFNFNDFNPRTHRGVRLWTRCQNQGETYFNPRTHRGVRHSAYQVYMTLKKFQSTHPSWGATRRLIKNTFNFNDFNPRTHRGVRRLL